MIIFEIAIGRCVNNGVQLCPPAKKEISSPLFMSNPKESIRHGGNELRKFWISLAPLSKIYDKVKQSHQSIVKITEIQDALQKISEKVLDTPIDQDRLRWLQYWTTKAHDLYHDESALQFIERN